MITDRFTAKVLGGIVVVMTVLIDVSCFIFSPAELRGRPTFPLVVVLPSLPFFLLAVFLFRKAARLPEGD